MALHPALFHVKHEPRMHQASRRPVTSGGGLRTELRHLRLEVPRAQQTLCSRTANALRYPAPNTPREIGWTTTPVIRQRHNRRRPGAGRDTERYHLHLHLYVYLYLYLYL